VLLTERPHLALPVEPIKDGNEWLRRGFIATHLELQRDVGPAVLTP